MALSTSLVGKVAIVTGSSRSIGAAIAQRLAEEGANVIVNYVSNAQAADEVINAINARGKGQAAGVRADASSIVGANQLLEETVKIFGHLDIIVLNAGIMGSKVLADVDEHFFDEHITRNVKGPLFLTKAAVPLLPDGASIFKPCLSGYLPRYRRTDHIYLLVSHQGVFRSTQCTRLRCLQRRHRANLTGARKRSRITRDHR